MAARACHRRRPDFLGRVLDPSGRRKDLPQFLLGGGERLQGRVERNSARRGRALVDGDESSRQAGLRQAARMFLKSSSSDSIRGRKRFSD